MRLFRPAEGPGWLERFAQSIERAVGAQWDSPVMLKRFATADLPTAANYPGGIVYDSDLGAQKVSDGTVWRTLPGYTGDFTAPISAWAMLTADYTLTSTTSAQKAFNTTSNGTLTLPTGVYRFETFLYLTTMSATSGNLAFDPKGGGTATLDRVGYMATGIDNTTPLAAGTWTGSASVTTGSAASVVTAGTGTGLTVQIRGMFRVSVAGTIIPSVSLVTAAAAVVKAGSYFAVDRVGESTETNVGAWT